MEEFHARNRTRRSEDEVVSDDSASLGSQTIFVQSLQSRPQRPLSQHDVSNLFPTPASRDERAFLPMPGIRMHDVAMGNERTVVAIVRAAQGLLWFGRDSDRHA